MKLSAFVLVSLALLQAGCAAMLASKHRDAPIELLTSQAEVFVDGVFRGVTPLHLELKSKRSHTIVLKKGASRRRYRSTNCTTRWVRAGWWRTSC